MYSYAVCILYMSVGVGGYGASGRDAETIFFIFLLNLSMKNYTFEEKMMDVDLINLVLSYYVVIS